MRPVRVVLAGIFGLFSLPPLIFGGYLLTCWLRIHSADVYYVEYPYAGAALTFIAIGAMSLFCAGYGALRGSFYGLLFSIPLVVGLMTMINIPDGTPHASRSMLADTNYLSSVNSFFRVWYEANQRFPKDESEFLEALKTGPAAWQNRVKSPPEFSFYSRGGIRLPYQLVVINNATGPQLDNLSRRPGVIYYCVSGDEQEFWMTMTALSEDVSRSGTLKRAADRPDGEPWILAVAGKDYPIHKP